MNIIWDHTRNEKLIAERGVSFDVVSELILERQYVANFTNYSEQKAVKQKLDKYEREIEESAESYRPLTKRQLRRIEGLLGKVRKARNINIRISEEVLLELKRRSHEEGIPYQTLISSVLHKFVTNRLVDEKAIRRSLQILTRRHHKTPA